MSMLIIMLDIYDLINYFLYESDTLKTYHEF